MYILVESFCGFGYGSLSSAPRNKVAIIPDRHSRMFLAETQKESLDASLRGHDGCELDAHCVALH
jgi:hypothetical protein